MIPVGGWCQPGYEAVRQAFVANFEQHGELGAAVCVGIHGRLVVDLWGGHADEARTRPWTGDTLVNVYSVGKGLSASVAAYAVAQGWLDPDRPVADLWPEFAAQGKGSVTVADVLSHRAGLPAVRRMLPSGLNLDHEAMAGALAAEAPWWEPGSDHGYHVNTFGYLVGEIIRRCEPAGRTLGRVLREDIAGPWAADVHIGLAAEEDHRVAQFVYPGAPVGQPVPESLPDLSELSPDERMRACAYSNPPTLSGAGVINTRQWRAVEIPSTNGHATARGVQRFYEGLAGGGERGGVRVLPDSVLDEFTRERSCGMDRVLGRPSRFGLGFQLTQPERPLGPNPGAYGHFGAGGSLGFCDPEAGVSFGYVMNQLGPRWNNPRNRGLVDAVYGAL